METKKLFRDRQEVGPDDLMDLQEGVRSSIDHIVGDAITSQRRFVGFQVTRESGSALRVAIGRLYQASAVYVAAGEQVISVSASIPLVNKKIAAIYVYGQPQETDLQNRNFVTDASTEPPTAVPQSVPMTERRLAFLGVVYGLEGVDPQMPALPDNACLIATVLLGTTGVIDGGITRALANGLPNLQEHHQRLADLDIWRTQTGSRVDALTSEQATLFARTVGKADAAALFGVMGEVSKIKRKLNLPSATAPYVTDLFADSSQIDQAASPVNTNYRISSFGGASFPHTAEAVAPLALFNPYEESVYRSGTDFVLPKFTPVLAVEVPGYSGTIALNTISVTTTTTKLMTGTKTETRYGYN